MAAYLIADVKILDPARYREYMKVVPATIAAYGGKFLVRGGRTDVLEGDWTPNRIVVLEFASVERAREWWSSTQYAGPKRLRQSASLARMIVVEGI